MAKSIAATLGLASPAIAPTKKPVFSVANAAMADKVSASVIPTTLHWDEQTRSIRVLCEDGNVRICRVDRLDTLTRGRKAVDAIKKAIKDKTHLKFHAAGGFSPDFWFYDVSQG